MPEPATQQGCMLSFFLVTNGKFLIGCNRITYFVSLNVDKLIKSKYLNAFIIMSIKIDKHTTLLRSRRRRWRFYNCILYPTNNDIILTPCFYYFEFNSKVGLDKND